MVAKPEPYENQGEEVLSPQYLLHDLIWIVFVIGAGVVLVFICWDLYGLTQEPVISQASNATVFAEWILSQRGGDL